MHTTAPHRRRLPRPIRFAVTVTAAAALAAGVAVIGCASDTGKENKAVKQRYATLDPKKDFPAYMKGTIWELTQRNYDGDAATASYGLVGRLRGTGDSTVSLPVRQWMIKHMARHGFGDPLRPEFRNVRAEQLLRDPGYAIVRVDAFIPPGARAGDFCDVRVSAMPKNLTTSLSGGVLFESDLGPVRSNSPDLDVIQVLVKAKGPVVVNPAYALEVPHAAPSAGGASTGGASTGGASTGGASTGGASTGGPATAQARASLRSGVIMGGGRVMRDRPLVLRLLQPQRSTARYIEQRINNRFQKVADHPRTNVMPITKDVAAAQDEGVVEVYVPKVYGGDWMHFISVVEHMYTNGSPANAVAKAKDLTTAAQEPGARLLNISYALEAIGDPALQYVLPLMANPDPDVSYAMARAAAFIGDPSGAAQETLFRMARDDGHKFQLAAIQALGALPPSTERNTKMRELLKLRNTLARIEAYKLLVKNGDKGMFTTVWIKDPRDRRPEHERAEKFGLDIVPSEGEPLVFATRSGIPRIALIGPTPTLSLPVMFTAMERRLMIASPPAGRNVTIFFRDDAKAGAVQMASRPDLAQIIARLGGEGAAEEERLDFSYGEIVAVLQSLSRQQKLVAAARPGGQLSLAPFIFEQPGESQDLIESAPVIEQTRPNTGGSASAGTTPPAVARK